LAASAIGAICAHFACAQISQVPAPITISPQLPNIPERRVVVTDFGAVGDGKTSNTEAFRRAIAATRDLGGGEVIVPRGVFLTGPIELTSNMALVLERGAVIRGSENFEDYDYERSGKAAIRPLIGGAKVSNVAIRGEGTIDGAGKPWWKRFRAERAAGVPQQGQPRAEGNPQESPRPKLILLTDCSRVLIQSVTLKDSPQFHLVPQRCSDVTIDDVSITAPADSPNTDGIDPTSSRNVLIRHCVIDVGDDNVSLKSNPKEGPTENVLVTNCTFKHGHGASVGSNVGGGIRHITVHNCTFEGTDNGIRIKSARDRGGLVQDVTYRDLSMKNVGVAITLNLFYFDKAAQKERQTRPITPSTPIVRDVRIVNLSVEGAKTAGEIIGLPEMPISGVLLDNVRINSTSGMILQDAKSVELRGVNIRPQKGQPLTVVNANVKTTANREKTPGTQTRVLMVSHDGTGDFASVQEAVDSVSENNSKRTVIHIKPGVYKELIHIPPNKPLITFQGDRAETTVLTFNLSAKEAGDTRRSMSTYVGANDFYAENITFENSYGLGSQAVAIYVNADRALFHHCRFLSWQDTLFASGGRQYYRDCYIEGHVDFIFGSATAVFEHCHIHCKGQGYVTAQWRLDDTETNGFVFRDCRLTGRNTGAGVFLGRPWRAFARVVFIDCWLGGYINPAGWDNWRDPAREKTAWFGEYRSKGPGANPASRVKWSRQLSADEIKFFATRLFLKGNDNWNPSAEPGKRIPHQS